MDEQHGKCAQTQKYEEPLSAKSGRNKYRNAKRCEEFYHFAQLCRSFLKVTKNTVSKCNDRRRDSDFEPERTC